MAENDLKIIKNPGPTFEFVTNDRTTSSEVTTMKAGEPAKESTNYVMCLADGDAELGTDVFVGIAINTSTETALADGTVDIQTAVPGTMIRGKATTAANVDTVAELLALRLNNVCIDDTAVTGTNGTFTIDEDETDDPNVHFLKIITGDVAATTLDCVVNIMCTIYAPYI